MVPCPRPRRAVLHAAGRPSTSPNECPGGWLDPRSPRAPQAANQEPRHRNPDVFYCDAIGTPCIASSVIRCCWRATPE